MEAPLTTAARLATFASEGLDGSKGCDDMAERGIQSVECGALYGLAWPCLDTENKALIEFWIPTDFIGVF